MRLGTVRRPPRGVPKADFARLDYYDVWFPNLSPSAELVQEALGAVAKDGYNTIRVFLDPRCASGCLGAGGEGKRRGSDRQDG